VKYSFLKVLVGTTLCILLLLASIILHLWYYLACGSHAETHAHAANPEARIQIRSVAHLDVSYSAHTDGLLRRTRLGPVPRDTRIYSITNSAPRKGNSVITRTKRKHPAFDVTWSADSSRVGIILHGWYIAGYNLMDDQHLVSQGSAAIDDIRRWDAAIAAFLDGAEPIDLRRRVIRREPL
jgi:hypothetical protein